MPRFGIGRVGDVRSPRLGEARDRRDTLCEKTHQVPQRQIRAAGRAANHYVAQLPGF